MTPWSILIQHVDFGERRFPTSGRTLPPAAPLVENACEQRGWLAKVHLATAAEHRMPAFWRWGYAVYRLSHAEGIGGTAHGPRGAARTTAAIPALVREMG